MQLVTAERDALLKPIQTVSGIVERRHTLPILSNLLLKKTGSELSFLATDIEVQISTKAQCEAGQDASTTVAARKLLDILRALPASASVSLELNNKKLNIKAGKSRFALQTLAAEDFPTVAQATDFKAGFSLSQKSLKALLALVQYAMAQQDIRYYLNGLLLIADKAHVRVVATDGHRLAYASLPVDAAPEKVEVIIPRKTVIELERLLEDSDEQIRIDIAATQVRFQFGNVELVSKLVEGKFPDYQRVIPSGLQEQFRDAPRRADRVPDPRGDSDQRKIQGRALRGRRRQPENHLHQHRPGRSPGRSRSRVPGRPGGHRLQRHLPARRAEPPEKRQSDHFPGRFQLQRVDHLR